MAISYQVTVSPAKQENQFQITWYNEQTREQKCFTQQTAGITTEEVERLWQKPQYQTEIGAKLYGFLDGDARYLKQAREEADQQGESLILHLCPCKEVADWPFELLCREKSFLLPHPHNMHLVRCISQWGKKKELPPGIAR